MNLIHDIRSALHEASPSLSRITPQERKKISNALRANPIFSGNKKVSKPAAAISPLAEVLASVGFTLDMVTGDTLLGDKGSRQLPFRRAHEQSCYEHPVIDNSRIAFTWEDLEAPHDFGHGRHVGFHQDHNRTSTEIIAYCS